jgi:hypothetical protein
MTQAMTAGAVQQGPMPTGGQWGWYRDHEGNEWRRVSKLVKYAETDTYNLDQWMKRQVAEGLAIRDDLVLAVKAMGRPDPVEGWSKADKGKLDSIAKDAMNAAKQADGARKGTAMHDLTERLDRGEDVENVVKGLPAGPATSLRAYAFLRSANGWRNIAIERTVVCDELEVAGSFDRIDEIPGLTAMLGPGPCQYGDECPDVGLPGHSDQAIADVKTETAPWMNGLHIAPQLAIYSRSKRMWEALPGYVPLSYRDGRPKMMADGQTQATTQNGHYVRTPCVRQDVGVVVHVLDGKATPYLVNLHEGWEAAQAAYAQMLREQRSKRKLGAPGCWFVAMPGIKVPAVAQMVTEQAVAAQYADPNRPTAAVDDLDRQAIETIWSTTDVEGLAKVWDIYVNTVGRQWGGRVAEAADARRRQIECPQRQLHGGGGKCACGWVPGVPA